MALTRWNLPIVTSKLSPLIQVLLNEETQELWAKLPIRNARR
jgi:hypothetical protein